MKYSVRLLDRDRQLVAVLDLIAGLGYSRRFGQATPITVQLPRSDAKTGLVQQAAWIEVWRADQRRFLARVSDRDWAGDPVTVIAMTPEILLGDWVTPRNWVYDGVDGADVVRDLCLRFRSFILNSVADWQAAGGTLYQVDLDTQPERAGDVIIARDAQNHHYGSGYVITPPIDLGADVHKTERVRWAETAGGTLPDGSPLTQITIQTRTGPTATPDGSWSAWSSEFSALTKEDAEKKGIVTSSPTARYIQVRVNLLTKDTFTPSEDGSRFGLTPVLHGLEVVARYQTGFTTTAIPSSAGKQVKELAFNQANHLQAMNQVCAYLGWDWYVGPDFVVHAGAELGADRSGDLLLRHGTNADIKQLADDDRQLVNVLHCYGKDSGLKQVYACIRDEESISAYGEREGRFEDQQAETETALAEAGQAELDQRKSPTPRFEVFCAPEDGWPDLRLGDTVRVASPLGIHAVGRVLEERMDLVKGQECLTLGVNSPLMDIIDQMVPGPRKGAPGKPSVPAPLLFRAVVGREQIGLLWMGVGDYYILVHSTDGATYATLDDRITGQAYVHTGLTAGTKHWYKARAVKEGRSSEFAGPVSATAQSAVSDDGLAPATPSGLALTSSASVVPPGVLQIAVTAAWTANTEADLADYMLRRRKTGSNDWDVIAVIPAGAERYVDASGLAPATAYEYAIAARDVFGNASAWSSSVQITTPSDNQAPGTPAGLQGEFAGRDALFSWTPCSDDDYRYTVLEVWVGGTKKRTEYTSETHYVYDYDTNRVDNGTASAQVTVRIAHEDIWGNRSGWASVTVTNSAPGMPSGFVMASSTAHIQMDCADPGLSDLSYAEYQLAMQSDYGDAITVYRGRAFQGVLAPVKGDGINYGRVRFVDLFGQAGPWATASCLAKLITRTDMQGAVFQILPTSDPEPLSGALEQLWDMDTSTGPVFASAPTVEFEFPIVELTDLVRFYADRDCDYYAQAYNEQAGAWVDVVGTSAAQVAATGGQWHVRRFDGGKMVAARRLRVVFDRALQLTELKFWRTVIADEILVGALKAWQIDTESITIGSLGDGNTIPRAIDDDTETYFPFDGGLASTRGIQPTFTRTSTATNPDTGATVAADEPRFVAGKFGKAVLVEEGTTNLVADPGAHLIVSNNSAEYPIEREMYDGHYRIRRVVAGYPDTTFSNYSMTSVDVTADTTYTQSLRVKPELDVNLRLDYLVPYTLCKAGTWTLLTITWTAAATDTVLAHGLYGESVWCEGFNPWVEYKDCQIEKKPYATSFVDGTRANEWLILPAADVLQADAGTIEGRVLVNDKIAGKLGNAALFTHANGTWPTNSLYMGHLSTGQLRVGFNTLVSDAASPVALVSGQWLHFAYRWNADAVSAFLDGQLLTDIPNTAPDISFGQDLHIGGYTSGTERANTCFCGLRIHRRALSDEEIAAHALATTAPYDPRALGGTIDADVRPVNLVNNQIRLDREGLRMRRAGDAHERFVLDSTKMEARGPDPNKTTFMVNFQTGTAQLAGDAIVEGTITYDRLKIAEAKATQILPPGGHFFTGGDLTVELLEPVPGYPGEPGTYWDQIKLSCVKASDAYFTVVHNPLNTLAGLPRVLVKVNSQWVEAGTQFEPEMGEYLGSARVSISGMTNNSYTLNVVLWGGGTSPGVTGNFYFRVQRHAIS